MNEKRVYEKSGINQKEKNRVKLILLASKCSWLIAVARRSHRAVHGTAQAKVHELSNECAKERAAAAGCASGLIGLCMLRYHPLHLLRHPLCHPLCPVAS